MPLYENKDGNLGYQSTIHGENGDEYIMYDHDEASVPEIDHAMEQSLGQSLQDIVHGELDP